MSFARGYESSSDSDGRVGVGGYETQTSPNVSITLKKKKISMHWQSDVTARCTGYARTKNPKYVVVHREERNQSETVRYSETTTAVS